MKIRIFLLTAFLSLLTELAVAPFRTFSIPTACCVGFTVFLLLSRWCFVRFRKTLPLASILVALLIGPGLLQLPIRFSHFTGTLLTFPDFIFHLLGIVFGLLHVALKSPWKWVSSALGLGLALFMFFAGQSLWVHKLNFGTFTGKVSSAFPSPGFEAFDQNRTLVTNKDFSGRVVVLDFWFTGCGACFKKFPQLQKIYEQYRNHPAVTVLAVNSPMDGDKEGQAFQMIREDGFSFPVVIAKDEKMTDSFGVEHYPTTVLINKHGHVVFKGEIEKAGKYLDELIAEK